jgi:hypothetical protein
MRRYGLSSWFFVPAIALAVVCGAAQAADKVEVSKVTHRKFTDCVEVKAGQTRLVVVPSWAGRISVLDFGGGPVLKSNAGLDGKVVPAAEEWAPWDGNATDVYRGADGKNQFKGMWLHPWSKVKLLPDGVELASDVVPAIQLSAQRRYRLSPDGRQLTHEYTITSHGGKPTSWAVWERATLTADGYAVVPVETTPKLPQGWMLRENTTIQPPEHAQTREGFLVIKPKTKAGGGMAARLRAGWAASVRGQRVLLITFPIDPKGTYRRFEGSHCLLWLAPDFLEFEPLSAESTLKPGESFTFPMVWRWLDLPADVDGQDAVAVGRWLESKVISQK